MPTTLVAEHEHHSSDQPAKARRAERFVFVDALRGLAAVGVVACHFVPRSPLIPGFLQSAMRAGSLGVQIFFVISGFVIAYSVRGARVDGRFLGGFALRRSLRLDPPYWATIACILLLGGWTHAIWPEGEYQSWTWPQVIAHLGYVQNFLGYRDLCVVFWTLRLEVLFYLLFILLLGVAQRLGRSPGGATPGVSACAAMERVDRWRLPLIFIPLAVLSLASFVSGRGPGVLQYIHMFLLGAMVWWTLGRKISAVWLAFFASAMIGSLAARANWEIPVALAAALAIYGVGRAGKLGSWLNNRPLQYLGRTSYSLYLIHAPVGGFVLALGLYLTGGGPWATIAASVVAVAVSFLAAEALYRGVEKPSLGWAKRLKRTERAERREEREPAGA